MTDTEGPRRIAYVLKMFPRLSETFILNEILELERQGAEVHVFSLMLPADGRFHGRLAELRLTVDTIPRDKPEVYWESLLQDGEVPELAAWEPLARHLRGWNQPKDLDLLMRAAVIAREVRRRGIQHLHSHFATIATRTAWAVHRLTGVPYSFTSHAKDIFRETVDRRIYSDLLAEAAFNVTVCDYNRDFILERTPDADPAKVVRLYNGIDLQFFDPAPPPPADGPLQILSVGRMVPKKGFDVLLHSLAALRQREVPFQATLVGDGEQYEALRTLCTQLTLEDRVTFTGGLAQEQVREHVQRSHLVALACVRDADGNQDALPTVLLEALAMDRPLVSTRVAGVPEIVGEEAGHVVEPGDPEAFADALARADQERRGGARAPGTCRRRAETLFDLRRNVAELHQRFRRS